MALLQYNHYIPIIRAHGQQKVQLGFTHISSIAHSRNYTY